MTASGHFAGTHGLTKTVARHCTAPDAVCLPESTPGAPSRSLLPVVFPAVAVSIFSQRSYPVIPDARLPPLPRPRAQEPGSMRPQHVPRTSPRPTNRFCCEVNCILAFGVFDHSVFEQTVQRFFLALGLLVHVAVSTQAVDCPGVSSTGQRSVNSFTDASATTSSARQASPSRRQNRSWALQLNCSVNNCRIVFSLGIDVLVSPASIFHFRRVSQCSVLAEPRVSSCQLTTIHWIEASLPIQTL